MLINYKTLCLRTMKKNKFMRVIISLSRGSQVDYGASLESWFPYWEREFESPPRRSFHSRRGVLAKYCSLAPRRSQNLSPVPCCHGLCFSQIPLHKIVNQRVNKRFSVPYYCSGNRIWIYYSVLNLAALLLSFNNPFFNKNFRMIC